MGSSPQARFINPDTLNKISLSATSLLLAAPPGQSMSADKTLSIAQVTLLEKEIYRHRPNRCWPTFRPPSKRRCRAPPYSQMEHVHR